MLVNQENKTAQKKERTEERRVRNLAMMVALSLVVGFFALFRLKSPVIQEIAFLALVIPALLQLRYKLADLQKVRQGFMLSLLYLVPVAMSFAFHAVESGRVSFYNLVILGNLYLAFLLACLFASGVRFGLVRQIMLYTALFSLPLFLYVAFAQRAAMIWGRWTPFQLQPNWWGMMVLGFAWGAMMIKNAPARAAALMGAFLYMVALQSRGSLVALLPVILLSSGFFIPLNAKKMALGLLLSLLLLAAGVVTDLTMERGLLERAVDYVATDVFLVDDEQRGLGSGLTGRTEGYKIGWRVFAESPFFGGGFGEYGFIHNGFLLTLAESGLLALGGMLFLMARALTGFVKERNWISLGLMLSYIAALLTFPRSFNINMTGFMFIILLMQGCARTPPEKKKYRFTT
ncbi:MAG: O-antigen ligase family protein [Alphaproteobacteria bacterium]|nr:O-antigen ligase family protein [Alphaproteobacteria bacterium]